MSGNSEVRYKRDIFNLEDDYSIEAQFVTVHVFEGSFPELTPLHTECVMRSVSWLTLRGHVVSNIFVQLYC